MIETILVELGGIGAIIAVVLRACNVLSKQIISAKRSALRLEIIHWCSRVASDDNYTVVMQKYEHYKALGGNGEIDKIVENYCKEVIDEKY